MSNVHKFSYATGYISHKQIKKIESFGLEILSIEGTNSCSIDILISGTFDQHQCINKDSELARVFNLD